MMRVLLVVGLLLMQTGAGVAEPVLLLNEPHDIFMAEHFCDWAEGELRDHDYLVKHFTCSKRELCKRALEVNPFARLVGRRQMYASSTADCLRSLPAIPNAKLVLFT
jgi:hypothetical protein